MSEMSEALRSLVQVASSDLELGASTYKDEWHRLVRSDDRSEVAKFKNEADARLFREMVDCLPGILDDLSKAIDSKVATVSHVQDLRDSYTRLSSACTALGLGGEALKDLETHLGALEEVV